ncbi:glucuronate isomerase [Mariniluteicoccus endophyticus]
MAKLELHPDRLFPVDAGVRDVTRRLYAEVADLPIISPHGHVPPVWLAEDVPFGDPTELLITPDHYVNRLLHASGVGLADLGVGRSDMDAEASRKAFRLLCEHWSVFRGTPVRAWFEAILADAFGVDQVPARDTADAIYDTIAAKLTMPQFRPRALFDAFGIEVLATTDDPCDDLVHHAALAADESFTGRVLPTFRPDRYLEPARADWVDLVDRLGEVAGQDTGTLAGWVAAMESRRAYFRDHGAVSADHSHADPGAERLPADEAERLYAAFRTGAQTQPGDAARLRRHLVFEMARMSADDGLVMTLHPAVHRNHHRPTFEKFGADVGCDIPVSVEWTNNLAPMLNAFGTNPRFQLVLFTLDETTFSREIGPLAGFYPSVYAGVPWWFIDAPEAIRRYRAAITESAGFSRTSGFIDDTRAFCSIPARHDMSRRLDAGFLAQLVVEHRLTEDEAAETLHDLVTVNPRRAFRL